MLSCSCWLIVAILMILIVSGFFQINVLLVKLQTYIGFVLGCSIIAAYVVQGELLHSLTRLPYRISELTQCLIQRDSHFIHFCYLRFWSWPLSGILRLRETPVWSVHAASLRHRCFWIKYISMFFMLLTFSLVFFSSDFSIGVKFLFEKYSTANRTFKVKLK